MDLGDHLHVEIPRLSRGGGACQVRRQARGDVEEREQATVRVGIDLGGDALRGLLGRQSVEQLHRRGPVEVRQAQHDAVVRGLHLDVDAQGFTEALGQGHPPRGVHSSPERRVQHEAHGAGLVAAGAAAAVEELPVVAAHLLRVEHVRVERVLVAADAPDDESEAENRDVDQEIIGAFPSFAHMVKLQGFDALVKSLRTAESLFHTTAGNVNADLSPPITLWMKVLENYVHAWLGPRMAGLQRDPSSLFDYVDRVIGGSWGGFSRWIEPKWKDPAEVGGARVDIPLRSVTVNTVTKKWEITCERGGEYR